MSDLIEPSELARTIDDAARSVAGVTRVYPADPAVVRSAKRLTGSAALPLSTVDGGSVVVCIGVSDDLPAQEVAAAVALAARSAIGRDADVRVRITRLQGRIPGAGAEG